MSFGCLRNLIRYFFQKSLVCILAEHYKVLFQKSLVCVRKHSMKVLKRQGLITTEIVAAWYSRTCIMYWNWKCKNLDWCNYLNRDSDISMIRYQYLKNWYFYYMWYSQLTSILPCSWVIMPKILLNIWVGAEPYKVLSKILVCVLPICGTL